MSALPAFGTIPQPDTPFPPALDTIERRVDAALHIQALLAPLGVELLSKRIPANPTLYMELCAHHRDLSAYFVLAHGVDHSGQPGAPPVHWHSSRALKPVPGSWEAVYRGSPARAVSYPMGLPDLLSVLWFGFQAASSGAAFHDSTGPETPDA